MLKELEYPFDGKLLLKNKKKIRKQLLDSDANFIDKKVAILGGSTTKDILQMLELFLLNNGIRPTFYESEYNQYYQDAMFPNEELEEFKPDIIYVFTTNRNITSFSQIGDTLERIDTLIDREYQRFSEMWDKLANVYRCPVIQNNFELPFYRIMGNKEASDIHGSVNFITRLNLKFYEYAQKHDNFYICDINYISADYGLREWADPFYYYMYKYAINPSAVPLLALNVANIIKSIFGKNKKGFVLDLDNTLWGGVIGDDGVDNIVLGPEESEGQGYSEFQRYIKAHKQLGIILNIDSKNDIENALSGLNHPDSELKPDDFICIKANWDPKDSNFTQIANDLSLLPESLVFIDDNPAERHIVSNQLKDVSAPEIGDIQNYIINIDRNGYFEVTTLSEDDYKRNEMYKENAERAQLQASFSDYGEYLDSLEMQATNKPFEAIYMSRIAQLTNKSNQFNLTTHRYTQEEIEKVAYDDSYITIYGKLTDRFGDNGVVSVVIGHIIDGICHIDLWLMSCRVLKRDMEFAMMDSLVHRCKAKGIHEIRGYYYPTSKNKMVRDFYHLQGFEKISEDPDGNTEWKFSIPSDYKNKNIHINVNE
ncbi:MAG: HAD-IIIC family phosphatase [Butyrivibrio sp.]|nr:HAD-IIIC family phosphatase [Butyrivibrio sp.]